MALPTVRSCLRKQFLIKALAVPHMDQSTFTKIPGNILHPSLLFDLRREPCAESSHHRKAHELELTALAWHNCYRKTVQNSNNVLSDLRTYNRLQSVSIVPLEAPSHQILPDIGQPNDGRYGGRAILDPFMLPAVIGDKLPADGEVIGDNPDYHGPSIQARHIQKIRRWHMNRHKLKRLRRRMKMVYRKRNYKVKKKKEAKLLAVMKAIRDDGIQFDALAWVKERLARAKKGGFEHSIWRAPYDQPQVPWKRHYLHTRKLKRFEVKSK